MTVENIVNVSVVIELTERSNGVENKKFVMSIGQNMETQANNVYPRHIKLLTNITNALKEYIKESTGK